MASILFLGLSHYCCLCFNRPFELELHWHMTVFRYTLFQSICFRFQAPGCRF